MNTTYTEEQLSAMKLALSKSMARMLECADSYIETIESLGMTNEQFFLNWLDGLNKISTKY